ncbi:Probable inactive receptor kinase At5g58300 [Linum grandiflorum]
MISAGRLILPLLIISSQSHHFSASDQSIQNKEEEEKERAERFALYGLKASPTNETPRIYGVSGNETVKLEGNYIDDGGGGSHSSSKLSSFSILFLMFDVAGLIAVILLFLLYCKKARKLEKMMIQCRGTPNSSKHYTGTSTSGSSSSCEVVVVMSEEEQKLVVAYPNPNSKELVFLQNGETAPFELKGLLKASAEGLGKGSFGNTYKAKIMTEGKMITVVAKRLRDLRPLSMDELTMQLRFIGAQSHTNLLTPLAYYVSQDEKLLVSKFVDKGNLFNRIHGGRGSNDRIPFRWKPRLVVARGVAMGLAHLHSNTNHSIGIIGHGNLKSSNVFLDQNDSPLVADYGFIPIIAVPIAAQRMVCYRSPEYQNHKRVSNKTDIWSYGCLLLELLTGRVPTYELSSSNGSVDLCNWVNRAVREEWTCEVLDVEIGMQRSAIPGMLNLLQLAMRCCDKSPEKRPDIDEVLMELKGVDVVMESEDEEEEEELSMDQSLEDQSLSTNILDENWKPL